ncbi:hypothetical protein C6A87_018540 [Mycobacterium sp. ITM-2016-00317]|uniref:hypothetical protein n=1 Tax=Mycobacterium sp. ITM-2016-00317 TaxID=2099694 RepID=UPI000D405D8F|nr:hypothetical protein [Mycobacterium sp. ITM-2016-00317]WNG85910.1 hypothetical protein C6A87_018540 [Mycobacterium sp. ITM-2016-00317]
MIDSFSATARDARTRLIYPALIVLGAVDLATLSENHGEAEDSVQYIMNVTKGESLFLPNHLLFNAINWLHYRLWTAFGYSADATVPMEVLSVAASLATLYLVHRIALRVGAPPLMALAAAGWTAFSYGFWVYSVEADTYLLPLPAVLVAVLVLFDIRPKEWSGIRGPAVPQLIALGALSAFAALLHQQYLFLIPIFGMSLIIIWRATPGRTTGSLITTTSVYGLVVVGVVSVVYCAVGFVALGQSDIAETLAWARGHASQGTWVGFSLMSFPMMLVGLVRVILGINFLASPHAADAMAMIFPGKVLLEEHYVAEHYIGTILFWVITAATLVAVGTIVWLTFQATRGTGAAEPLSPRWTFTRFGVIYLAVYAVLILIWEPYNLEFWIGLVPILAILLVSRLIGKDGVAPASIALALALAVANFFGGVWPYSHADSDYWTYQNAGLMAIAGTTDVIVTECVYVCQGNLVLSTGARLIPASSDDTAELSAALANPSKGRLLVSSWAFAAPEGVAEPETAGPSEVRSMLEGLRDRFIEVARSGSQTIWQVMPADRP